MCNQPRMLKDLLADEESVNLNKKSSPMLFRSRSKAALTTIFAFKKALKYLKFSAVKSPLPLLSSVKSSRNDDVLDEISSTTVQVKDILRWNSFRDLDPPLDHFSSTTTTTTSTGSSSGRTSWCDSDFTVDDSDVFAGDDCTDQKSTQFEQNLVLVNVVQAIKSEFETNSNDEQLLFDLFRNESNSDEIDLDLIQLARNWMSGENGGFSEWRFGGSKEMCMREMEEWRDFEEEEMENMGMEIEDEVLRCLMNEVLVDLCCS